MAYMILKGEMAKRDVSIEAISKLLDLHRNSVAYKINSFGRFAIDESILIRDAFFPDWELTDLFKTEDPIEE